MFLRMKKQCFCLLLGSLSCFYVTQSSYAFKCNDKHTHLVTDIRKCRVCYWNMKLEQQNNKMARENLLHKIVRAEISGTHRKQSKIQNKKSYYEIC